MSYPKCYCSKLFLEAPLFSWCLLSSSSLVSGSLQLIWGGMQVGEMVCAEFWFPVVYSLKVKAGGTQSFSLTVHLPTTCTSRTRQGAFCAVQTHTRRVCIWIYGTEISASSLKKLDPYWSAAVSLGDRGHLLGNSRTPIKALRRETHIMQVRNTQTLALVTHNKGLFFCWSLAEGGKSFLLFAGSPLSSGGGEAHSAYLSESLVHPVVWHVSVCFVR